MDINTATWHDRFRVSTDAGKNTFTAYDIKAPEKGTRSFSRAEHPQTVEQFEALWADKK